MNLALFHACKAGKKSTFFVQWEVAGIKQSLGSKNNGVNVSYILHYMIHLRHYFSKLHYHYYYMINLRHYLVSYILHYMIHLRHYFYSLGTVLFPLLPTEQKRSIFAPPYKHENGPNSYLLGIYEWSEE